MEFLQEWGYLGLFIGTFLAATVVPFSSDFLIIGILLAGGSPGASWAVASLGNWLGGITSFGLGWLGKWEWIERFLKVLGKNWNNKKAALTGMGPGWRCFPGYPSWETCLPLAWGSTGWTPKSPFSSC